MRSGQCNHHEFVKLQICTYLHGVAARICYWLGNQLIKSRLNRRHSAHTLKCHICWKPTDPPQNSASPVNHPPIHPC